MGLRNLLKGMIAKRRQRGGAAPDLGSNETAEQRGGAAPDLGSNATAEQRGETANDSEGLKQARKNIIEAKNSESSQVDLSDLKLQNRELAVLLEENKAVLSKVYYLDLSGNKLTALLPDEMASLRNLVELNLSNNNLKTVPTMLEKMKRLQALDLSNNQLKTVPDKLETLKRLKVLNLSNNQLKTLPPTLGKLEQLEWLALSNNILTTIAKELGELRRLTVLDLSQNYLMSVPSGVYEMTKRQQLEELFLHKNDIKDFGPDVYTLQGIPKVNITDNPGQKKLLDDIEKTERGLDFATPQYYPYKEVMPKIWRDEYITINSQIDSLSEKFSTALGKKISANQVTSDFFGKDAFLCNTPRGQ